jgi:hypothetical protein
MSFFYDLNKKLDGIRATPEVTHQQLNERDMSRAAKGYEKYGKQGMEALAKAGREGKALDPVRKKYDKYDNKEVSEDFGPGREGPNRNQAGPSSFNPDSANYKTPTLDKMHDYRWQKEKDTGKSQGFDGFNGAADTDARGQQKYVDRTAPGVINKIKDKMGWDKPDPEYGPRPDETQRLAKRYPKPTQESGAPAVQAKSSKPATAPAKPSKPAPKSNMGTIKGGVWTADPPKPGERGVPAPSGDPEGVPESGAPMTAKQKSFAKLAPPADKITFADKIAGAKKEVDEMLGDVAAEAMRSALGGGKGRNAGMEEGSEDNAFTAHKRPSANQPKVGSVERGAKHDIKHTATGRVVTRRTDDQGISVGADDDSEASGEKRGRGRPKGTKNVGSKAKVFQRKSKLMTREGDQDITDQGEYDQEGDMAKDDIKTIVRHAQALSRVLGDDDNLPEWVQSKLAKIEGMMISIDEYMQNQEGDDGEEEPIAEKAVSKQQQKFMGMAHAMQKGEKIKGASKELKKVARTMKPKDTEDFAKTKHKGLPDKVKSKKKEEDVEESTTSGSVATSTAAPKSGGMGFGKGIYDSMNRELEQMIAESMSINMSDSTEGNKSLTVTATDDDAMKLAMMLKSAGLGGQGGDMHSDDMHSHGEEACDTCGMQDCGCGDVQEAVDENSPDWPTNTETSNDALQYAGGLNKPKTDVAGDGQTTIPNTAVHTQDEDALRRMMEMAGLAEAAKPDFLDMDKDGDKKESMKDAVKDKEEDSVDESIQRMREMAGIKEAKKPDFLDMDKDGDKKEPMSKAIKDKEEKKVDESIFALTNQWKAYKG